MKRLLLVALLALPLSCTSRAGRGSAEAAPDSASRDREAEQVMELERSYWAAELRHDSATVANLLAPDYVSMSSRGRGDRSRAEELALLFGGRVHLESYQFSNMRGRWIARDVLALHYLVDQRFTVDGRTLCPQSGSMTVWARRGGHWLRVARTEYALAATSATECPGRDTPSVPLPGTG